MSAPTIKLGTTDHPSGKAHFAEFTPEGMLYPVRVYGTTEDAALELAWDFLDDHDRELRAKGLALDIENDPISHPAHYTRFPVEVIELTENLNFCRGNAVKYIARAGFKDPSKEIEDLEKALWYIEREIARLEREGN